MMWGAMKGIRIARVGLAAATLTGAVLTTAAQAQEGTLVKSILSSIGIIGEDKDPIEYRERAPLVLPPRMELREPLQPGSAQARNQQWPNDPDVAAQRRKAVEDRTPITQSDQRRMSDGNGRLTLDEMRAGRQAGAQLPTTPQSRTDANWIHPDILREQGKQGHAALAAEETGRRLTEPPLAYRRSATGRPVRSTWEPTNREDEADPKAYRRNQMQRNNQ